MSSKLFMVVCTNESAKEISTNSDPKFHKLNRRLNYWVNYVASVDMAAEINI